MCLPRPSLNSWFGVMPVPFQGYPEAEIAVFGGEPIREGTSTVADHCDWSHIAALQAAGMMGDSLPRALPWALVFRPFRPLEGRRRHSGWDAFYPASLRTLGWAAIPFQGNGCGAVVQAAASPTRYISGDRHKTPRWLARGHHTPALSSRRGCRPALVRGRNPQYRNLGRPWQPLSTFAAASLGFLRTSSF
jgi:hypothetical protein